MHINVMRVYIPVYIYSYINTSSCVPGNRGEPLFMPPGDLRWVHGRAYPQRFGLKARGCPKAGALPQTVCLKKRARALFDVVRLESWIRPPCVLARTPPMTGLRSNFCHNRVSARGPKERGRAARSHVGFVLEAWSGGRCPGHSDLENGYSSKTLYF